ncbi:hypothetical protein [Methanospirillum sp.]|uniref:hypothetical protein n=1 Tax=Methanospirillum sp. TaxID=45200 RepID=UPI00359FA8AE
MSSFLGDDMNQGLILAGCIMLLFAGLVGADSISSTIICDRAAFVSSSVFGQGQSYASNLFTTDPAALMRSLIIGDSVQVSTTGQSSGPMGIDEYSGQVVNRSGNNIFCLPDEGTGISLRTDEIRVSGLLTSGKYVSGRILGKNTSAMYLVNGSGIFLTRAYSNDKNRSVTFGSDVAGAMNVSEKIVFGDEYGY